MAEATHQPEELVVYERQACRESFERDRPRVEPLATPDIQPTRWMVRWGGVVI